jgi:enoyl-CoA hydratase
MSVHYEIRGPTALITIDRPERRNAVNLETADLLQRAWQRFDADEQAVVGVLTGTGEVFSAGADLKDFDLIDRPDGFLGFTRMIVSKPTIAAIEGYCVAGGLEMALWCDLRVAGEGAVFGCFERRFGVPLVDGGTQRLPRIVGLSKALDMILTGRPVDAGEAIDIGLADRLSPAGSALETALELADIIAAFPQATVRSDRLAVLEGLGRPPADGLAIERRHGLGVLDTAANGAARFEEGSGRSGTYLD